VPSVTPITTITTITVIVAASVSFSVSPWTTTIGPTTVPVLSISTTGASTASSLTRIAIAICARLPRSLAGWSGNRSGSVLGLVSLVKHHPVARIVFVERRFIIQLTVLAFGFEICYTTESTSLSALGDSGFAPALG
jgi:hypothetical protein